MYCIPMYCIHMYIVLYTELYTYLYLIYSITRKDIQKCLRRLNRAHFLSLLKLGSFTNVHVWDSIWVRIPFLSVPNMSVFAYLPSFRGLRTWAP